MCKKNNDFYFTTNGIKVYDETIGRFIVRDYNKKDYQWNPFLKGTVYIDKDGALGKLATKME